MELSSAPSRVRFDCLFRFSGGRPALKCKSSMADEVMSIVYRYEVAPLGVLASLRIVEGVWHCLVGPPSSFDRLLLYGYTVIRLHETTWGRIQMQITSTSKSKILYGVSCITAPIPALSCPPTFVKPARIAHPLTQFLNVSLHQEILQGDPRIYRRRIVAPVVGPGAYGATADTPRREKATAAQEVPLGLLRVQEAPHEMR